MPAIRDPVHQWIKCSDKEMRIIDSPLFQRLQWVSQLSSVKQIFPGGVHTRFLHSIGAMKLAGKYMSHLLKTLDRKAVVQESINTDKYYKLARLSALLHDIGHGPFSHAFDRTIYSKMYGVRDGGHDYHRLFMVKSSFLAPLLQASGIQPEEIIAVWNPKTTEYENASESEQNWFDIIRAIVQGPLGADRMDFTLRDSYFTGTVQLGTIAVSRIINNCRLLVKDGKFQLGYHTKCISDIIQALNGRYYMYDSVYLHKTSSAANILIEKMLKYSAQYLNLEEKTRNLDEFQWLNDAAVIGSILAYAGNDENMQKAKIYCQRYLQRRLPKLQREIMEPAQKPYNPSNYLDASVIDDRVEIMRTRVISGIDPEKFELHKLVFYNKEESELSCSELLNRIKYTNPQDPYYLVRIYK